MELTKRQRDLLMGSQTTPEAFFSNFFQTLISIEAGITAQRRVSPSCLRGLQHLATGGMRVGRWHPSHNIVQMYNPVVFPVQSGRSQGKSENELPTGIK
ncbi:hypothetical protein EVG20_g7368 [Dentipellis fragilis]|uniref:Uncharacterized protein n=1 Tax=Dentipellis fragilis TaxID=205917 RepID=A0A4Y9YGL3_9AGAM|nr:hypothetical protein EVG20_g7368 [Dentipellis fragilis]